MSASHHEPGWRLHAGLISRLDKLAAAALAVGIEFDVTSGARGFEKQALMYTAYLRSPQEAREKYGVVAKPAPMGLTRHHPFLAGRAIAVDIKPTKFPTGKEAAQKKLGEMGEAIGLVWGGRWGDPVHFELAQESGARYDIDALYVELGRKLDELGT